MSSVDTKFWTKCNPSIEVAHTNKKYYNKYLYKIVVYCPAGRLIDRGGEMATELAHRKDFVKQIPLHYQSANANKDLGNANIPLLETMRNIRKGCTGVKLRVEEPRIQIYASTEDDLIKLAKGALRPFVKSIETVASPADNDSANLLNSGAIIRKQNNGYSHKVLFKDGRYKQDIKESVLKYLTSLPEGTAGIPASCSRMLSNTTAYVWNCYFFTNDPSVTTFLDLISPGIVSNIHEIVVSN